MHRTAFSRLLGDRDSLDLDLKTHFLIIYSQDVLPAKPND